MPIGDWEDEEALAWNDHPKDRPKEFKLILRAIVATMAMLHNNCGIAYAMLKTGGFCELKDRRLASELSHLEKRFDNAICEHDSARQVDQS